MKDFFRSFKVSKPEFVTLKEGEQVVRIIRAQVLTSFQNYDGSPKEESKEWTNPIPQLAITVVAAEDGKSGGLTHRFNGEGCRKYNELSEKELASGKYEDIEGYACYKDKDGDVVREESDDNTKACENIINQFAMAMQFEEGADLMNSIEEAIQTKATMQVTVINEPYNDKDQFSLSRFRAVVGELVEADDKFED